MEAAHSTVKRVNGSCADTNMGGTCVAKLWCFLLMLSLLLLLALLVGSY